jgi:Family of unknown function (DUF6390)
MSYDGVLRFGRYAFPPNELGYCGPDDHDALLGYVVGRRADQGLVELSRRFEGAYPYLRLIAESNGIADPFDGRVVEAYWIGNRLLKGVDVGEFRDSLHDRFAGRMTPQAFRWLGGKPLAGAAPHHNFHVFEVYTRAGLMNGDTAGPFLEVMDSCRISWARVEAVHPDQLVVSRRPLELSMGKLALGAPREAKATARGGGYIPDVKVGQVVSMHWSWACEVLKPGEVARLCAATSTALEMCSQTI